MFWAPSLVLLLEALLYTEDCINSAHLEAASPHDSPVVFKGSPGLDEAL